MKVKVIFQEVARIGKRNAPTILMIAGVASGIAAEFYAGKAAIKAYEIVKSQEMDISEMSKKEVVKLTWKEFAAPAAWTSAFILCCVGSHTMSLKRQAVLAGAYTISSNALAKLGDKTVEMIGRDKASKIKEEALKDRWRETDISKETIDTGHGDTIFIDTLTGQKFKSSYEHVKSEVIRMSSAQASGNQDCIEHNWLLTGWGLRTCKLGEFLWDVSTMGETLVDIVSYDPIHDDDTNSDVTYINYSIMPVAPWCD